MMTSPWEKLDQDDALRVDADGRHDYFWVVLEGNVPGLMLRLPDTLDSPPKLPKLKNLKLEFRPTTSGSAFVIGLFEMAQIDIFEIFCKDIIAAGETAEKIDDALLRTIQRTRRWHHLMRGGTASGLSVDEQRDLVGNLALLKELISAIGPLEAIKSWSGPTGSPMDFRLNGNCVKIKTHSTIENPKVSISSVNQLTDDTGNTVFLRVANIVTDNELDCWTLHEYVSEIEKMIVPGTKSFELWEESIFSIGYDYQNEYENRKWHIEEIKSYKVAGDFPRIMSPLPLGIEDLKYNLSLGACAPFELKSNLIEIIRNTNHE